MACHSGHSPGCVAGSREGWREASRPGTQLRYFGCPGRNAPSVPALKLGKGFLATVRVDAQGHMGRKMVSPGCALSTPPHLGPAQRSLPDWGV